MASKKENENRVARLNYLMGFKRTYNTKTRKSKKNNKT